MENTKCSTGCSSIIFMNQAAEHPEIHVGMKDSDIFPSVTMTFKLIWYLTLPQTPCFMKYVDILPVMPNQMGGRGRAYTSNIGSRLISEIFFI